MTDDEVTEVWEKNLAPAGMKLIDPRCGRQPSELPEYIDAAREDEYPSAADYVWDSEGTLNRENGHFLCTECYIAVGMPSSSQGWKCP